MHPLLDPFDLAVNATPQRIAAGDQSLVLEYAQLRGIAGGLAKQIAGLTDREHVGVLMPTSSACAASLLACWYAGRVPVPLNFLLPPAGLAAIAKNAELDLIVTIEPMAALCEAIGVRTLVLKGNTTLTPADVAAPRREPSDLATILYTSGTSGDPKGVRLTFGNVMSNVAACALHARINADEVFVSPLPQFHSFGLVPMTVVPLTLGATAWFLPRFSPAAVVAAIAERRATIFMAVASMFGALVRMKSAERQSLATLRLAVSGGEPLPRSVYDAMHERFGVTLAEGYGLTETSPVVSINVPWDARPGSVGRPLEGIAVRSVRADGSPAAAGEEGELLIEGHCVMQGYHQRPAETAACIRSGVFRTGDAGRVDADGFVYITGRTKEMIIVGGENVFPREIENALCEHPAVSEAAAIGVRDDLRGETPRAFVILNEGATASEAELRTHCRERLAGYKVPREIRIEKDLPRGPTGKILKRALPRE
jgi:long-chain acyl-CoA synthetase